MCKHGGMWCVNSEMLCLPFMTVVLLCLYFFLSVVLFWGCEWVAGHVVGGEGEGGRVVVGGVTHSIY